MKIAAIIQARTGSERLPSKVLETIGDRTILEWVVHRTRQIPSLNRKPLLIATTTNRADRPIIELCRQLHVTGYRGPEHDLIRRYRTAANLTGADTILRITADCPLLDPELADQLIHAFQNSHAAYAAHTGWPTGLTQEIFNTAALGKANRYATTPYDREHVVTWMIRNPRSIRPLLLPAPPDVTRRLNANYSIDTQSDLDRMRTLYQRSDGRLFDLTARQILELDYALAA